MAIISLDALIQVGKLTMGIRRFDYHEMSGESGESADREIGVPRWVYVVSSPDGISQAAMAKWKALLAKLRGRTNFLAAWDVGLPAPRGTMRGTMTLSASAAKGATQLSVTAGAGQAGTTLLEGDWLQVGTGLTGQLVMVVADATANGSGVITVSIEHPIRLNGGYASSTAVTWDKALGHYKMVSEQAQWTADGGLKMGGAGATFMEQW
jgi:hypothetical protein